MRYRPSNFLTVSVGVLLLCIAAVCEHVTLASGGYATLLLASRACAVLGAVCLAAPAVRIVRARHGRLARLRR